MTYGSAVPALTYGFSGFVNGDTAADITGAPTLTTTAKSTSAAGAYPITIKAGTLAAANYTFTLVNGTMTVTKVVLTVTASNASRVYGAANPAFSVNYAGFVNGDTSAVVAAARPPSPPWPPPPARRAATPSSRRSARSRPPTTASPSSTAPSPSPKATLTVTANAATRTYGASDPAFTVKYTGFLNGDTVAVLSGAPSFTTTAAITSPVGAYTVSPAQGTLAATSYHVCLRQRSLHRHQGHPHRDCNPGEPPVWLGQPRAHLCAHRLPQWRHRERSERRSQTHDRGRGNHSGRQLSHHGGGQHAGCDQLRLHRNHQQQLHHHACRAGGECRQRFAGLWRE